MTRKAIIEREKKRKRIRDKYAKKRLQLKTEINRLTIEGDYIKLQEVYRKFRALPRDASPVRGRRRCIETGRPRGHYRKVGLGRTKFRERAMRGEMPGLVKSSW